MELTVISDKLDSVGMVVDFQALKKQLREFLTNIDHVCLNDLPYFKNVNPSTENIAQYIYHEFSKICHPLKVKHVRVWESETSDVTYYETQ